jgi:nicotinamide-nucleotide amidase
MAESDNALAELAQALGARLVSRGQRLAAAESCTGGWIAKAITDIPGSSRWFGWGFVTYANEAKTGMLDVPAALLESHGAVSEPVARAMADAARAVSGADFAVAVTGIAGPDGGLPYKPVGTVWFAWAGPAGTRAEHASFDGDRESVRRQSVVRALRGVLELLEPGSA